MTEYLQITDAVRVAIDPDESSPDPRVAEDGWYTGFVKIPERGDSRLAPPPAIYPDELGLLSAWHSANASSVRLGYRAMNATGRFRRPFDPEDVVTRWARVFHDRVVLYDPAYGGFWWVRMTDDFSADRTGQLEIIAEEQETYRLWAEGAVMVVTLERLTTWCRLLSDGTADRLDTRDTWEPVESLGDVYLLPEYGPAHVVAERWTEHLDETEKDALIALLPAASPLAGEAVIP